VDVRVDQAGQEDHVVTETKLIFRLHGASGVTVEADDPPRGDTHCAGPLLTVHDGSGSSDDQVGAAHVSQGSGGRPAIRRTR